MIKQFFAVMILITVMANAVFANNGGDDKNRIVREVKISTPVKKITIFGSADVILTMSASSVAAIEGNPELASTVKLVNKNGELKIFTRQKYGKNKPVIRIPVYQLNALEVHGDGKVFTESILRLATLSVFINGACEVNIRSMGNILIDASPQYDLTYIKNEKIRIVQTSN